MRYYFFLGVFFLFLNSCLEEFTPERVGAPFSIVVEGNILQGTHGTQVFLTRSFDLDEKEALPITSANLGIRDDQGNEYALYHTENGLYIADTSQLKGIPGRSYQLFGTAPPGVQLESDWMLMLESAELENLNFVFEERPGENSPERGVQIFLDAVDPRGEVEYYRWEYEETWIFRVPYPTRGTWDSQTNTYEPIPSNLQPHTCWDNNTSSSIHLGSTDGLVGDQIANYPIKFTSTKSNQLYSKYSILIKQYSISKETHEFWRRLKSVTEELGTLFDPIPSEIEGNVRNLSQEDIPVIGYFSADGYQEKRLFISRSELPNVSIPSGFANCLYDTVPRSEVNSNIIQGNLFVEEVFSLFGSSLGFGMTQARCADCTLTGTSQKPDFWD